MKKKEILPKAARVNVNIPSSIDMIKHNVHQHIGLPYRILENENVCFTRKGHILRWLSTVGEDEIKDLHSSERDSERNIYGSKLCMKTSMAFYFSQNLSSFLSFFIVIWNMFGYILTVCPRPNYVLSRYGTFFLHGILSIHTKKCLIAQERDTYVCKQYTMIQQLQILHRI